MKIYKQKMTSIFFYKTDDTMLKDEAITAFDKFDMLGIKWEGIFHVTAVDDVT